MKQFKVYKHTNKNNGKSYIGITSMPTRKRWKSGYGYELQPKFWNAIKKHGWSAFSHEILAEGLSKEEACNMEKEMIAKYDTIKNGYNTSAGGMEMDCAMDTLAVDKYNPNNGELICSYKSMMEAAEDVGTSDSHISEACRGKLNVVAGYGWTYHGKPYTPPKKYQHFRSKYEKIDPLTREVVRVYETLKEAAEDNNVSKAAVCMCYTGKTNLCAGFEWRRI